MKRLFLSIAILGACTAMAVAQDQNANSNNPAAGHPQGTTVTKHETDTIVQPKAAPVKVTPSVVKNAQKKLNEAGYKAGPDDGIVGPQTRAAIKKYQTDQKLNETGTLDRNTLAALNVGGVQTLKSAPADLGRGGKAIGHDVVGGHPVAAGEAAVKSGKTFGKKVGEGTESEAMKVKNKVGSGLSTIGSKVTGAGEKTKNAGQATEQKSNETNSSSNSTNENSGANPTNSTSSSSTTTTTTTTNSNNNNPPKR